MSSDIEREDEQTKMPEKFYDADGNEVSLDVLCQKEPAWAANNIRVLWERVESLTDRHRKACAENDRLREKLNRHRRVSRDEFHCCFSALHPHEGPCSDAGRVTVAELIVAYTRGRTRHKPLRQSDVIQGVESISGRRLAQAAVSRAIGKRTDLFRKARKPRGAFFLRNGITLSSVRKIPGPRPSKRKPSPPARTTSEDA